MNNPSTHFADHVSIDHASYGKGGVRLLVPSGPAGARRILDMTLSIAVEGDFVESYRSGENRAVLPSDTLRRHALAESRSGTVVDAESFVDRVARRLLRANPAIATVSIGATCGSWTAVGAHTFTGASQVHIAEVVAHRDGRIESCSGVSGIRLLAMTGSAFTGFMVDEFTVQGESFDRPICGTLDATWSCRDDVDPSKRPLAADVTASLIAACSDRPSNAIQQLLTESATAVLEGTDQLARISLRFESLPLSEVAVGRSAERGQGAGEGGGDQPSYEIGTAPRGITAVTVARGA